MREKEKEYFPHKEEICILIMCVRLKEVWAEVENEGIKRLLRCFAFCCNPNSLFNKDYSKEWTQNGVCTGSSETSAFLFGILEFRNNCYYILYIPLRVRRAHGNRSGYPSVRFEEIRN